MKAPDPVPAAETAKALNLGPAKEILKVPDPGSVAVTEKVPDHGLAAGIAKAPGPMPAVETVKALDQGLAAGTMKAPDHGLAAETAKAPNERPFAKKAEARAAELRETGRKGQETSQENGLLRERTRELSQTSFLGNLSHTKAQREEMKNCEIRNTKHR
jgi:hypothetical protein